MATLHGESCYSYIEPQPPNSEPCTLNRVLGIELEVLLELRIGMQSLDTLPHASTTAYGQEIAVGLGVESCN